MLRRNVEHLSNKTDTENFPSARQEEMLGWTSFFIPRLTQLEHPTAEEAKDVQTTLSQKILLWESSNVLEFLTLSRSQSTRSLILETSAWCGMRCSEF